MALIDKIDALNTAANTAFQEAFGDRPEGTYQQFTQVIPMSEGTEVENAVADATSGYLEWLDEKAVGGMRTLSNTVKLRKFHRTFSLPREKVQYDKAGVLTQRITQWIAEQAQMLDAVVYTFGLSQNPVGYDSTALLANSHPFVGGSGTSDNLIGAGLTVGNQKSAIQKLLLMKDEAGEPLAKRATHLMVGPADEEYARQLTGSERPVGVDQDGEFNGSGTVAGATKLQNYTGGVIDVIVNPRITAADEYYYMDLSGPSKPVVLFQWRAPELISLTDPEDHDRFYRDRFVWSIEADVSPTAGDWRTVVGNT